MSTTVLRNVLRRLQADPSLCRAIAVEVQRIRKVEQERERAAQVEVVAKAAAQLVERLAGIERAIEGIRRSDHQRRVLSAMRAAAWQNGHHPPALRRHDDAAPDKTDPRAYRPRRP